MLVYLISITGLAVTIGLAAYFLIRHLVNIHRMTAEDGKGYFMILMFLATFISCSVAYFSVAPEAPVSGTDGDPKVSIGVLLTVAVSIAVLATGLLNLKDQDQYS